VGPAGAERRRFAPARYPEVVTSRTSKRAAGASEALSIGAALAQADGAFVLAADAVGNVTAAHGGAALDLTGLPPETVLGEPLGAVLADRPRLLDLARAGLAGEAGAGVVEGARGRAFDVSASPLRDPAGVLLVGVDATRHVEAARRAQETRFRTLYESAPVMLHSIDRDGRLARVSDRWLDVLGYERSEVIGRRSTEFLTAASARYAEEVILPDFFRTGVCTNVPYQLVKKSGELVDVLLSATAERDASGAVTRSLAVLIDVTERNRMQSQLVQADRLASLGLLAAGVAHEINNPLSYVHASLAHLDQRLASDVPLEEPELGRLRELTRTAFDGAERVRRIVADLRLFGRPAPEAQEPVDVNRVLVAVLELAAGELRHVGRVSRALAPVPAVAADEARLGQVFLNLVVNAAHATREAGGAGAVTVRSGTDGGDVVVEVADQGPGIAPEHVDRIFDPFFTTKPVGLGSGLGLSICHGIVRGLDGAIEVDTAPGGATFRVRLPASAEPAAASRPPAEPAARRAEAPPAAGPRRRLLVVDDDPAVARSLQLLLEPFEVEVATSGADAVARCLDAGPDVVLCDVLMPDMLGLEVRERVRARAGGAAPPFLFMTGGAFTAEVEQSAAQLDEAELVQKPFDLEAVSARLAALAGG